MLDNLQAGGLWAGIELAFASFLMDHNRFQEVGRSYPRSIAVICGRVWGDYRAPWATASGFGSIERKGAALSFLCCFGQLPFRTLRVAGKVVQGIITLDGEPLRSATSATSQDGTLTRIYLSNGISISAGQTMFCQVMPRDSCEVPAEIELCTCRRTEYTKREDCATGERRKLANRFEVIAYLLTKCDPPDILLASQLPLPGNTRSKMEAVKVRSKPSIGTPWQNSGAGSTKRIYVNFSESPEFHQGTQRSRQPCDPFLRPYNCGARFPSLRWGK